MEIEPSTEERLKKHTALHQIVHATMNHSYKDGYLPPLIIWFRERFENDQIRLTEILEWDDETMEDFFSWGHNSRWANTFWAEMDANFDAYVNTAMAIEDGEYDNEDAQ